MPIITKEFTRDNKPLVHFSLYRYLSYLSLFILKHKRNKCRLIREEDFISHLSKVIFLAYRLPSLIHYNHYHFPFQSIVIKIQFIILLFQASSFHPTTTHKRNETKPDKIIKKMIAAFPTTTRRLLMSSSSSCCSQRISSIVIGNSTSSLSRRCLSTHGQEAVGRLKDALEQYRVQNYQQEIPSRFKKDIIKGCSLTSAINVTIASSSTTASATATDERSIAVEGIEQLLRNIGVFGDDRITHDDVEIIVTESCEEQQQQQQQQIRADEILLQLL